jgi:transcriptional regulator of acetoin/glycerol metabolism
VKHFQHLSKLSSLPDWCPQYLQCFRAKQYDFPGNVRELENMIERAIVVGNGKEIRLKDLPIGTATPGNSADSLQELEKNHILQTLNKLDWNISRSAKLLKVDRVTLYNKIKKYNLRKNKGK